MKMLLLLTGSPEHIYATFMECSGISALHA